MTWDESSRRENVHMHCALAIFSEETIATACLKPSTVVSNLTNWSFGKDSPVLKPPTLVVIHPNH